MKYIFYLFFIIGFSQKAPGQQGGWYSLFNGKSLKDWNVYSGHSEEDSELRAKDIFVEDFPEGGKELCFPGKALTRLISKRIYGNYHFHMMYKWGEKKDSVVKSAILYHVTFTKEDSLISSGFDLTPGNEGNSY